MSLLVDAAAVVRATPSLRYLSGLKGSPSVSKSSQALSSTISCFTGNISVSLSLAECVESSLLLGVLGVVSRVGVTLTWVLLATFVVSDAAEDIVVVVTENGLLMMLLLLLLLLLLFPLLLQLLLLL